MHHVFIPPSLGGSTWLPACGSQRGFHCSSTSGRLDHGHNMITCFTIPCMNMLIIAFIYTMINHVSRNFIATFVITAVYNYDVSCTVYLCVLSY